MIISHKYKFIFLKTRKTAGTSIEIALSRFCGDKDIITPISPEDENTRKGLGYRGPQNCNVPFGRYSVRDWVRLITRRRRRRYYNHISAGILRELIDREIWDSYFKFCFERNPWDKALSLYYWRIRNKEPKPFLGEFLKKADKSHVSNFNIYAINGTVVADYVGLYENLVGELGKIAERLRLPDKLELPQAKGTYRKDRQPYQQVIGSEEKDIIAKVCSAEIAAFHYSF